MSRDSPTERTFAALCSGTSGAPASHRRPTATGAFQGEADMAYARIVHHWDPETATSLEVGSDEAAHPDLLDELTARVLSLYRETVGEPADEQP
jgi:hypothetical protein